MRFIVLAVVLGALAACATPAAGPATPTQTRAAAPTQASSRAAQYLASAGQPSAPTQADIERVFGRPDIVRQDGAGAALTYRLEHCALLLLFEADQRNALRLAEAHASARRSGESTPSLDQCAVEAPAR